MSQSDDEAETARPSAAMGAAVIGRMPSASGEMGGAGDWDGEGEALLEEGPPGAGCEAEEVASGRRAGRGFEEIVGTWRDAKRVWEATALSMRVRVKTD
jgi:hypothetical protein